MNELMNRLINHANEHPVRLAGTNAGILAAVQLAPIETGAKTLLVLLTCLVTGMSAYQKWQGRKRYGVSNRSKSKSKFKSKKRSRR
jgi:hypothetical protein